jgi:hypothetical protein
LNVSFKLSYNAEQGKSEGDAAATAAANEEDNVRGKGSYWDLLGGLGNFVGSRIANDKRNNKNDNYNSKNFNNNKNNNYNKNKNIKNLNYCYENENYDGNKKSKDFIN